MLRIISLLIALVVGLVLIAFLVANTNPVIVSFDPFNGQMMPALSATGPLWIVLFVTFVIGFLFGAFVMWFSQGSWRAEARRQRRRARMEAREKERLKAQLGAGESDDYGTRIGLPAVQ